MIRMRDRLRRCSDWLNKRNWVQFGVRRLLLPWQVKLVKHHDQDVPSARDVIVLSVVRNAAHWIDEFLDHHRRLGVHHFAILDNGSTDETVDLLVAQNDVTLLRSNVPYHAYENTMKRYLVRKCAAGSWCLFVDADELFDWPFRRGRMLPELVRYLERRGFNAVVCQLLDMWSPQGLASVHRSVSPQRECGHYTLSGLTKTPYPFWITNCGRDERIQMHWGGIRRTLFGAGVGLTKVSLFRADVELKPFCDWHHVRNASIADFTCALFHYPFTEAFRDKVREAVMTRRYGYITTGEYERYLEGLQGSASFGRVKGARELVQTEDLVAEGFLVASDDYKREFA
jgi:hypothetical protein